MNGVATIVDRSMSVPPGHVVRTGYADIFACRPLCRERMSVGDIDRAYQKRLQLGADQSWPCPNGEWQGETFLIHDGRHEWLAAVALGQTHILVAWIEHA